MIICNVERRNIFRQLFGNIRKLAECGYAGRRSKGFWLDIECRPSKYNENSISEGLERCPQTSPTRQVYLHRLRQIFQKVTRILTPTISLATRGVRLHGCSRSLAPSLFAFQPPRALSFNTFQEKRRILLSEEQSVTSPVQFPLRFQPFNIPRDVRRLFVPGIRLLITFHTAPCPDLCKQAPASGASVPHGKIVRNLARSRGAPGCPFKTNKRPGQRHAPVLFLFKVQERRYGPEISTARRLPRVRSTDFNKASRRIEPADYL